MMSDVRALPSSVMMLAVDDVLIDDRAAVAHACDDIAAAVLFFCLPESGFTTGQTLLVDGAHDSYLPEF